MSGLRKKERVDFQQRSTDQLSPIGLRDWLLHSGLPIMQLKSASGGSEFLKAESQVSRTPRMPNGKGSLDCSYCVHFDGTGYPDGHAEERGSEPIWNRESSLSSAITPLRKSRAPQCCAFQIITMTVGRSQTDNRSRQLTPGDRHQFCWTQVARRSCVRRWAVSV
jgi:hypothetical protein